MPSPVRIYGCTGPSPVHAHVYESPLVVLQSHGLCAVRGLLQESSRCGLRKMCHSGRGHAFAVRWPIWPRDPSGTDPNCLHSRSAARGLPALTCTHKHRPNDAPVCVQLRFWLMFRTTRKFDGDSRRAGDRLTSIWSNFAWPTLRIARISCPSVAACPRAAVASHSLAHLARLAAPCLHLPLSDCVSTLRP